MALPLLQLASQFDVTPEMLEPDGVHLIPSAGDLFLSQLSQNVAAILNSTADVTLVEEINNVESGSSDEEMGSTADDGDRLEAILKIVKGNSKKLSSVQPLKDSVVRLAASSKIFEDQVRLRRQRDNLVFSRMKEEADCELNRSRENRVVISRLQRASAGPSSHQEKKDHYKGLVTTLVQKACPDLNPQPSVVDVIVNIHREQATPTVEIKFDSVNGAFSFRKSAAALAKAQNSDFASLFFSNSVTQATRVRIEIMKAIAKKLTTLTEEAFVQGFLSRPVLRYLARDPTDQTCAGTGRSYSFVDSVSRFGDLLFSRDLTAAYRRAGSTFQGAMEQYFVVLKESEDVHFASGSNRDTLGDRGRRGSRFSSRGSARGSRGQKRAIASPPGAPSSKKPSASTSAQE